VSAASTPGGFAPTPDASRDASRFRSFGDRLFQYRGELAVPFLLLAVWLGRPVFGSFVAGIAVSALGELIRLAALRHIGPKSRRTQRTGSHGIVRTGPYAWTRNPLYLGNWVMVLGVLVALDRSWLLAAGVIVVPMYYLAIIKAEERALKVEFGEAYARYLEEVPRLLPRPPKGERVAAPYGFRDIILPEMNTIVSFEITFAVAGALAVWRAGG
jgi:protein-S-isoprenylcysteine O-methyltransferase Ste14